ncbi:MAG: hypothetical protein ACJA1A_003774 [Saprospiraceae bacterium]
MPEYGSIKKYEGLKGQRLVDSQGDIWLISGYKSDFEIGVSEINLINNLDQSIKIIKGNEYQGYYLEAGFEKLKTQLKGRKIKPKIRTKKLFVA